MTTLVRFHANLCVRATCDMLPPDRSYDHKCCVNGEIMFLVCHEHEHMFRDLCEFMGGSPSWKVTTLPCLMVIGLVQVET